MKRVVNIIVSASCLFAAGITFNKVPIPWAAVSGVLFCFTFVGSRVNPAQVVMLGLCLFGFGALVGHLPLQVILGVAPFILCLFSLCAAVTWAVYRQIEKESMQRIQTERGS